MKKIRCLLTFITLIGPSFCLLSCDPTLSSVSIEESLEGAEAEEAKFEDFSLFYVPERGGYLVGDYKGSLTSIVVPDEATGEDGITAPIVGLADYAFYGRKGITTVLLGEKATYIGDYAFGNTEITDLRVAGAIDYIGEHTFDESNVTFYEKNGIEYLPTWEKPYGTAFCDGTKVHDKLVSSPFHCVIKPGTESIESGAFYGCESILSIAIPTSVTSIGSSAFSDCTSLASIVIPSSVDYINQFTFINCSSLTSIEIPSSVTFIGPSAFEDCSSLTSIEFPTSVTYVGYRAFFGCGSLSSVIIGDGVKTIDEEAFSGCRSLSFIVIGKSVSFIDHAAFGGGGCPSLSLVVNRSALKITAGPYSPGEVALYASAVLDGETEYSLTTDSDGFNILSIGDERILMRYKGSGTDVSIPSSVTSIGNYAFYDCRFLTSVEIPSSVTSIGENAFAGCHSLAVVANRSSLDIKKGSDSYGLVAYYASAVINGETEYSLTTDSDGFNILSIGDVRILMRYKGSGTDVVIPSTVTVIAGHAFDGCTSMTSIEISSSVESIGNYSFSGCSSLKSVEIPSSVTSIGSDAFAECSALSSVVIGRRVKTIGSYAFSKCSSLKTIEIPSSVSKIEKYTFSTCSSLSSVVINDEVRTIGERAFYNCSSLTSISIPSSLNSLKTIEDRAFEGCSSLRSIIIPTSVTYIGGYAFSECTSLTVYCRANNWEKVNWDEYWDRSSNFYTRIPVKWGYKGQ